MNTPALDFLRKVQVWQEDEANKTAGLVVVMPDREQDTLAGLLRSFAGIGATSGLENRARMWLVGYRELEDSQRVLTDEQRAELHAITDRLAADCRQQQQPPRLSPVFWIAVIIAAIGLAVTGIGIGIAINTGNGSPPASGAPVNPP